MRVFLGCAKPIGMRVRVASQRTAEKWGSRGLGSLGAWQLTSYLTRALSGPFEKTTKTVLTSFATVVYCWRQANTRLTHKYLLIAIYLRADVCVQEVLTVAFTCSSQHSRGIDWVWAWRISVLIVLAFLLSYFVFSVVLYFYHFRSRERVKKWTAEKKKGGGRKMGGGTYARPSSCLRKTNPVQPNPQRVQCFDFPFRNKKQFRLSRNLGSVYQKSEWKSLY